MQEVKREVNNKQKKRGAECFELKKKKSHRVCRFVDLYEGQCTKKIRHYIFSQRDNDKKGLDIQKIHHY